MSDKPTDIRKYLIASMGLTVLSIIVAGRIFKVGWLYITVPVLCVLIATIWFGKRLYSSPRRNESGFWVLIMLSVIFSGTTAHFLVESIREGWRWGDVVDLIFPALMVPYLLWFAFKYQRRGSISGANADQTDVVD